MFESKQRPINIPQMEHSRLSGVLAAHWGNDQFARPPIDFHSFVRGVTLHDWPYGHLDAFGLGSMSQAQWLEIQQRGLEMRLPDTTADLLLKLHYRRLLSWNNRDDMVAAYDRAIAGLLSEVPHTLDTLYKVDTLTQFCDMVAFDFSFERPTERTLSLYADFTADPIAITYTAAEGGHITVTPWPFAAASLTGVILGYQREGYPHHLDPVILNYNLTPGSA